MKMRVDTLANPYFLNLYIPTSFFFFFFFINLSAHSGHTLDPPA
jgi:hypothetical protein